MSEENECQIFEVGEISPIDYIWLIIDKLGIRKKRALKLFDSYRDNDVETSKIPEKLNLKVGDMVEIRTEKEIVATLKGSRYRGLSFMPEMLKYCGKKYKVLKRIENYIVEGNINKKVKPKNTVILEGVFCDGSWHGGCDRTCYCLWREKWLRRI
jgi:hypothetical protein